jgi:ribosome-associated protein
MARAVVENGEVLIDGAVCLRRGTQVRPGQTVEYAGEAIQVVGPA